MGIPTRQELEINEDYSFHRKMWVVQRVGWLLMAVFIAATMAGVFGLGGWASAVEKKNSWGTLKYDRFLRWQGPTTIELRVESAAVKNGEFEIWISNDYLKRMNTETFFPVPKSVIVHADRSSFVIPFRSDPSG
ncbi:MAG TPA: hypothetical protein PL182_04170, partial [Pseudobdellovibrionaceae bacterium]|nr:hypothetical protein [Pseudobdellovibrionaceae bacterium]